MPNNNNNQQGKWGGYSAKQWQQWYGGNGKGGNSGYDNSYHSGGNNRRVWLSCPCGNSVPADRKWAACSQCGNPWLYPSGCKHDPQHKLAAATVPDTPTTPDYHKLLNDPKAKQLFESLGQHPALKEAVEGFTKLLTMVAPKEATSGTPDPAAAAKALRDASAKLAAVKGKQHHNQAQIEASQNAMVSLLKVQRTLELEEKEADEALALATSFHKAATMADTSAKEADEAFFQEVQEEMELNTDP